MAILNTSDVTELLKYLDQITTIYEKVSAARQRIYASALVRGWHDGTYVTLVSRMLVITALALVATGCFDWGTGTYAWFVVRGFYPRGEPVAGPYATQEECESAAAAWRRSSRVYPYPYYACEQR